jgi:acetyl-CoA carboxylase biotin carboxyl carrier protein
LTPDEMKQLAQVLQKMPGLKSIELKDVKRLADLLRGSPEIGSIEVQGLFGTKVVITRTGAGIAAVPPMVSYAPLAPVAPVRPDAMAPGRADGSAPAGNEGASAPAPAANLKEIRSPMVGTFYMAPEPGADAYASVGTRIAPGQTVCIIEAMKIMNEIEAEVAGVVREVLVDDATPVEYGQVLFRVDPNG